MILMEDFVSWLNAELDRRGWSRSEAARRGGISASMFDKVINGYAKPGLDFCVGVSRAFSVSTVEVLQRAGLIPPPPPKTAQWLRLNELWGLLSDEDQERILEIVEAWAQKRGKQPAARTGS